MNYRRLVSGLSPARSKRVAADVDVDAMTDELHAEAARAELARLSHRSRLRELAAPPPEPADEYEESEVVAESEECPTMISFSKARRHRAATTPYPRAWPSDHRVHPPLAALNRALAPCDIRRRLGVVPRHAAHIARREQRLAPRQVGPIAGRVPDRHG